MQSGGGAQRARRMQKCLLTDDSDGQQSVRGHHSGFQRQIATVDTSRAAIGAQQVHETLVRARVLQKVPPAVTRI